VVIITRKTLLELARLQQQVGANAAAQLAHERHMLAHVARQPAEFGVFLDEALHVGYRFDVGVVLRLSLVLFHVLLDVAAEIAKVEKHVLLEEGILVLCEHDFLEINLKTSVKIRIKEENTKLLPSLHKFIKRKFYTFGSILEIDTNPGKKKEKNESFR
jgi:hypothetical protein